jgi:hypothetical protein
MYDTILVLCYIGNWRDGAVWLACEAHNLEVDSSNLSPAIGLIAKKQNTLPSVSDCLVKVAVSILRLAV